MYIYVVEIMPDETIFDQYLISENYYKPKEFSDLIQKIEDKILKDLENNKPEINHLLEEREWRDSKINEDGTRKITKAKVCQDVFGEIIERLKKDYNFKELKIESKTRIESTWIELDRKETYEKVSEEEYKYYFSDDEDVFDDLI